MANFDNLKAFDVKTDASVKYDITEIRMGDSKTPSLMVQPATEANKPFARAQLARSNKRVRAAGGRGVSLEAIEGTRDDDRTLYPRFVITGWENVFDTDGSPVPFSVKNCEEFLTALPNWIFDGVRGFCTNPSNFAAVTDPADDEALGNS